MKLTYHQIQTADIPAIFSVRLSTIENAMTLEIMERDYGITPQSLSTEMEKGVRGWLCKNSKRAVGFAIGDRSNGEVQVVAVRPEYEGRGIGKTLLTHVQNWLFSEGLEEIWLLTNPDPRTRADGFYRKLGWQTTEEMRGNDEMMKLQKPQVSLP